MGAKYSSMDSTTVGEKNSTTIMFRTQRKTWGEADEAMQKKRAQWQLKLLLIRVSPLWGIFIFF